MVTVVLTVHLALPGVSSLKEKRRIVKSMLTRLRRDFNISIGEVGDNDIYRSARIGAAVVATHTGFGHSVIAKVVNKIESTADVVLNDYHTETY